MGRCVQLGEPERDHFSYVIYIFIHLSYFSLFPFRVLSPLFREVWDWRLVFTDIFTNIESLFIEDLFFSETHYFISQK